MKKIILIFSLIVFLTVTASSKESVNIVTLNWGVHIGEDLLEQGVHAVIIKEAFKRSGREAIFKYYPWKRAYRMGTEGMAVVATASWKEERSKIFLYSKPYDNAATYAVGLKGKTYTYDGTSKSLASYKVGIMRGHYMVDLLKADGVEKIQVVTDDISNFKKLLVGRIDVTVIAKMLGLGIIKQNPNLGATVSDFQFLEPPLKDNPVSIILLKTYPNADEIINDFDKGLDDIMKDGFYESTMARFGFQ